MSIFFRRTSTIFARKLRSFTLHPSSAKLLPRSFTTKPPPAEDVMLERPSMTGFRRGWVGKETDHFLYFRMDMPGLSEKHIQVSMDATTNTLVIEGEKQETEIGDAEGPVDGIGNADGPVGTRRYTAKIDIPSVFFKTDEIKTEIAKGVLKVLVPKVDGAGRNLIEFKLPNMEENPFLVGERESWYAKEVGMELNNGLITVFDSEAGMGTGTGTGMGKGTKRCLMVKIVENVKENPFIEGVSKHWEKDGAVGLVVRVDMPGLVSKDLKIYREADTLVVEGKGEKESEYEGGGTRYIRCRVDVSAFFKPVRFGVMSNGVFTLLVPPRERD